MSSIAEAGVSTPYRGRRDRECNLDISTVVQPCGKIWRMIIVPEAQTAILRTTAVAVVAIVCIVGAIRTNRRWVRVLLAIVAFPSVLFAVFGVFTASLILRYGPC